MSCRDIPSLEDSVLARKRLETVIDPFKDEHFKREESFYDESKVAEKAAVQNRFADFHVLEMRPKYLSERTGSYYNVKNGIYIPINIGILVPKTLDVKKPIPIHVKIHGGGFVTGYSLHQSWFAWHLLQSTKDANGIILAPDYRLMPEHDGQDIIEDIDAFWNIVRGDKEFRSPLSEDICKRFGTSEINLDWHKVMVSGESAGGFLAAYSGLTEQRENLTIRTVYLQYPMLKHYERNFPKKNAVKWMDDNDINNAKKEMGMANDMDISVEAVLTWHEKKSIVEFVENSCKEQDIQNAVLEFKAREENLEKDPAELALKWFKEKQLNEAIEQMRKDPRVEEIDNDTILQEGSLLKRMIDERSEDWIKHPRLIYMGTSVTEGEANELVKNIGDTLSRFRETKEELFVSQGRAPLRMATAFLLSTTKKWKKYFQNGKGIQDMLERLEPGDVTKGKYPIDNIKSPPILPDFVIFHGTADINCPIEDTKKFNKLLRQHNKDVKIYFEEAQGETHGFDYNYGAPGCTPYPQWLEKSRLQAEKSWIGTSEPR
ncbi:alpha/beta-hydrolase [Corynespora cassiicola Philippines]|uniref:Alpha/beta-hydrolase n=1 Tax=Corynespora cassiicola Philippines TaxID=1448308 RepID=A0A2T2N5Z5_CORCC|nr:alpha/beta-hydrolase [Corynespora cassiicola Philippines]